MPASSTQTTYKVKCQTCKYAREFGAARVNAELGAVTHRQRFRGADHIVDIVESRVLFTLRDDSRNVLRFDNDGGLPPF